MTSPKMSLHPPHPNGEELEPQENKPNVREISTQDYITLAAILNARPRISTTELVPFFPHLSPTESPRTIIEALRNARRKLETEGHGILDHLDPHGISVALQAGSLRGDAGKLRETVTIKALTKASYAILSRQLQQLISEGENVNVDLKKLSTVIHTLNRRTEEMERQDEKAGRKEGRTKDMPRQQLASLIESLQAERRAKEAGDMIPGIS